MRSPSFLRRIPALIVFCALLPLADHAAAAEGPDLRTLSLEELMNIEVETVTSASRQKQKVTEAPASVTIITADDIKAFGYRTLADILNSVRGFSTTYDRTYRYLGVRGFGPPGDRTARVLLLLDGHRMNDSVREAAAIGTDFILDVDLIERIEISRGPGSSLYGSNAFFGVVNVITRRHAGAGNSEMSGEAASFRTAKARLTTSAQNADTRMLVSGTRYSSKGEDHYFREYDPADPFFDPRAADGGFASNRDSDRLTSWFGQGTAGGFTVEAAGSSREKGIPTASFGTDFNRDNTIADDRSYLELRYGRALSDGSELSFRMSGDLARTQADHLYGGVLNRDRSRSVRAGGELQLNTTIAEQHRVVAGMEYTGNLQQDQRNTDLQPFVLYLDDERRSRQWGAYLQDDVRVTHSLSLTAGVRYDRDTQVDGSFNPRLAAIVSPFSGSSLKFLYGSAFRSPSVYEQYYQVRSSSPPLAANPALRPETIKTYEAVFERFAPGARAALSAYYYRIGDLIEQTLDDKGNLVFRNIDRARAQGVELEAERRWNGGASIRASYALQRAVDGTTGQLLENSPRQLAKVNVLFPLIDLLQAALEEQYADHRRSLSGRTVEDRAITNLTLLGRNHSGSIQISLSCYNVFNTRYQDPVSIDLMPLDVLEQDGRTFRLKVTYGF